MSGFGAKLGRDKNRNARGFGSKRRKYNHEYRQKHCSDNEVNDRGWRKGRYLRPHALAKCTFARSDELQHSLRVIAKKQQYRPLTAAQVEPYIKASIANGLHLVGNIERDIMSVMGQIKKIRAKRIRARLYANEAADEAIRAIQGNRKRNATNG